MNKLISKGVPITGRENDLPFLRASVVKSSPEGGTTTVARRKGRFKLQH